MDTRTDPGQYYPGGRVMVRPDVAPPQVQINVSWSEIHGKPNFSEIAALGAADTLGTVKQTMNTVVNKLKTSVLIICAGMATVCAAVAPQFAALDDIPGNRQIMTNTQEYVDAKVGAVPVAGNYAVVSNAAMSALQPSATNGLITKAEVDLRFETTPSLEDISDLSDRIIAVSRSAVTTNDVCNIVTNEVDEYVMEMEGDYWMVEQTTARFVVSDVVWTPRGDGQYTVSFRANGVAKSIGYPDSVANSVICTDRDCYVYFSRLDYGLTVAEMMPELSMPNQWALTMGTTGGHDGGADSFVHRVGNALGLATTNDLAALSGSATNYTDTATNALRVSFAGDLAAAISATNTVFSNAVLSVGLGIDTNAVAAINALVEQGDELPVGEAATVGALLLALAAAVAALKRGKADVAALRYTLNAVTPETVNGEDTAVLSDRAINDITYANALTLVLPAASAGHARDFLVRIDASSLSAAPSVDFAAPGSETLAWEVEGGEWPLPESGAVNVWSFTEVATGRFLVALKSVEAVS